MNGYAVPAPGKASVVMLAALVALLPLGVFVKFAFGDGDLTWMTVLPGIMVSLLPAAILLPAIMTREVRFDGEVLTVKAALHTRNVAVGDLDLDAAEIVDLRGRWELRPLLRMFGFGLVGYRAGHFWTLKRKRVFALITRFDRVLVLPERSGKTILVSLEHPERLLQQLKAA